MTDVLKDPNSYKIIAFLIPGLIILYVRIQFLTGRYTTTADQILYYSAVSIAYFGLTFPLSNITGIARPSNFVEAVKWFAILFAGPALCGALLGIGAQKNWIRSLFCFFGINLAHPTPTAWDWKFGQAEENWVLVTLKNGTKFAGFAGSKSFMSSEPAERDILIERVYDIDDQNDWNPRDSSVLILGGEISTIETWPFRKDA